MKNPLSGALHGYESYDYLYCKKITCKVNKKSSVGSSLCETLLKVGEAPEVYFKELGA